MNGLELDNVYVEGVLYLTGSGDMKVNNSYFTNKLMINSSKGKVSINNIFAEKYSYFQGEIYINDSEFNDEVDIYGIGEIKNSRIDSKSLYGLHIRRNINQYCRFVNEVYDQESFLIDNVTIRGASAYGVSYDIVDKAYDKFEIKNSDLSDNFCSFEASVQEITCSDVGASPKASIIGETYNAKLLESKFNNYNVVIENTKLVCACSQGMNGSALKPSVYITANNTWMKSVNRTSTIDNIINKNANVLEMLGGRVLIEFVNNGAIDLGAGNYKEINSYFNDLKNIPVNLINWYVVDKSLLRIENGLIVPLEAGETDIYGSYNNNEYVLHVKVTGIKADNMDSLTRHLTNPNTIDQLLLVLFLFFINLIFYLVGKFTKKKIGS